MRLYSIIYWSHQLECRGQAQGPVSHNRLAVTMHPIRAAIRRGWQRVMAGDPSQLARDLVLLLAEREALFLDRVAVPQHVGQERGLMLGEAPNLKFKLASQSYEFTCPWPTERPQRNWLRPYKRLIKFFVCIGPRRRIGDFHLFLPYTILQSQCTPHGAYSIATLVSSTVHIGAEYAIQLHST